MHDFDARLALLVQDAIRQNNIARDQRSLGVLEALAAASNLRSGLDTHALRNLRDARRCAKAAQADRKGWR